jgi:non-ribosomal peptide synthetase component F
LIPINPRCRKVADFSDKIARKIKNATPGIRPMSKIYEIDLDRNAANFQPLTPLSFLERAAGVFPDRTAIVHGARTWTYAAFYTRARRLASALAKAGIGDAGEHPGDDRRPLRGPDDRRRPQHAQHPARRGHPRLHP